MQGYTGFHVIVCQVRFVVFLAVYIHFFNVDILLRPVLGRHLYLFAVAHRDR